MGFSGYGDQDAPVRAPGNWEPVGCHIIRRLDYAVNGRVISPQKALPFATGYDTIFCEHRVAVWDERAVSESEPAHIVAIQIIGEIAAAQVGSTHRIADLMGRREL
jgi:hypothetical protein